MTVREFNRWLAFYNHEAREEKKAAERAKRRRGR